MTLRYRALFSADDPADVQAQRDLFQSWLDSCGIGLQLPEEPGAKEDHDDPKLRVAYAHFDNEKLAVQRFESSIPSDKHVVTTSLTTLCENDSSTNTLWLEQDYALLDSAAEPTRYIDVPTLVGMVLTHGECLAGDLPVLAEPRIIAEGEIPDLIDILKQPTRVLPLLLVQPERSENADALKQRCGKLQQRISGLASIFIVDHAAAAQLNATVEANLEMPPGVVRVFMPGFAGPGDDPKRHQSIPGFVFKRQPDNAAIRLQHPLISEALKRHLPEAFNQVSSEPGFPNHVEGGDEDLMAEIIEKDTAIETLEKELTAVSDDNELNILELDETTGLLDNFRNRIRFLEGALTEAGKHDVVGAPTPVSSILSNADSCVQAVTIARVHLTNLEIADTDYLVAELDNHPKSPIWARKAWQSLVALNEFAQMTLDGDFDGNFWSFCDAGDHPESIPARWVAMKESESTSSNPVLAAHRTFPIDLDGVEVEVFMCAHIKIQLGGSPAPRIHFYDDCVGPSQKIHIGYFGTHLPL